MTNPGSRHSQIRVLVVDDEASIRMSLTAFLEDYDFDVSEAQSAEEALELMEYIPYNVGIIDLRLPGMSGDALILIAQQRCPHMHFIIHTGSSNYSLSEEMKIIGLTENHLFLKPVADLMIIVETVEKLVNGEVLSNDG